MSEVLVLDHPVDLVVNQTIVTPPTVRTAAPSHRGLARPVPPETIGLVTTMAGTLFVIGGCMAFVVVAATPSLIASSTLLLVTGIAAVATGAALLVLGRRQSSILVRHFPLAVYLLVGLGPAMITVGQYAVGPNTLMPVVLHVVVPIFAFYLLPRARAIAVVALETVGYGVVLALQPGYAAPFVQWVFVAVMFASIGAVFGGLLNRAVDEAERLSRLRRFLSPQVANAVLSAGTGEQLQPHRRRIAVIFCDLRGFTRFSGTSEPEDVVEVLDEFFHTAGALIDQLGATVGGFAGDGIMAYFNDPVPCEDPAGSAVELATRLQGRLAELVAAWHRRGVHLSFGVGVSYGYATLGVIGFEGRNDYTALGSVVNLASRLSDVAGPGEVLIDERAFDACRRIDAEERLLTLKGFADPVTSFCLGPR